MTTINQQAMGGNGAYIAQSNADNLQKISYWKNNVYDVGSVQVIDSS